ncbi:AAA domain-containing protein [Stieleria varia]|uniref:DNA helicase n=1 Tax=Stieleria varia TaxID=2528005 RepID=A0A5C6B7T7_9BACT|nr:AAA domain-containing protein [Stieleria varia]TWU08020.1 ATP-dependent RecD-like DNA helicase [Stieleria varia]
MPAPPIDTLSPDHYFDRLERWLELEGDAERERMARRRQIQAQRDAEATGETIVQLEIQDHRTGLAGRLLIDLVKLSGQPLPMNRLKVGSPVVLSDNDDVNDPGVPGVVSKRKHNVIQVATDRWPEASRLRLDLSPDETTRRRQLATIARARMAKGRSGILRDMILNVRPFREPKKTADVTFLSQLNPPQQAAVRFALASPDLAILHGPPGTGKTTTLAEIIYQAVKRGQRVLACAPSNTAVDNLLERLVSMLPGVLRVGHPARVFEALRGHTLDELVDADPSTDVIRDMRREVDQLIRAASKFQPGREGGRKRAQMYAEAGQLRGQIRALEKSIVRHLIESADVICTTTTIDEDLLGDCPFDLVVIDEACQCTESSVWQALLRADQVVMAGDHCQLPPTVLSDVAAREGMRDSMMQRLILKHGDTLFRRLTVQYRMHESIMEFSSREFYDGELIADVSVRKHRLCDLPDVIETPLTSEPLELIDTAGAGFDEQLEPDGESKLNRGEAKVVLHLVRELMESGIKPRQIAIIAPYAAQVRLLRNRLDVSGLEVDTVDGFQGREKEVVIITFVRSNTIGEIGFLGDTRRTNVALTRAKRKLIVIGDSATLGNNAFYARMLEYFESQESYRSVWEYVDVT